MLLTVWGIVRTLGVVVLWILIFLGTFLGYVTALPFLVFSGLVMLYLVVLVVRSRHALQRDRRD